jgi:hypothetical protein
MQHLGGQHVSGRFAGLAPDDLRDQIGLLAQNVAEPGEMALTFGWSKSSPQGLRRPSAAYGALRCHLSHRAPSISGQAVRPLPIRLTLLTTGSADVCLLKRYVRISGTIVRGRVEL